MPTDTPKKTLTPAEFANSALASLDTATHIKDSTAVETITLNNSSPSHRDLTGTNGTLEIRKINLDTYNGPKQEDFIALATSYYEAALHALEYQPEKKQQARAIFEIIKKEIQMFFPAIPPNKPPTTQQLSEKITIVGEKLKTLVYDFSLIIENDDKKNEEELEEAIVKRAKKLRSAVKDQIAQNGRPNAFHLYEVPGTSEKTQRISMVTTIGDRTDPSSVRNGKNAPLANFVRRSYGKVEKDSDNKPVTNIQFSGITHSSYPPVDLFAKKFYKKTSFKTDLKIREIAIKGVEAVIQEIAKQAIANGETTNPLPIKLTTLSLLTPFYKQATEHIIRPRVSEARQLKEVTLALKMYQAKGVKIKTDDGKEIRISLDMTHINMPTNLGGRPIKIKKELPFNLTINKEFFLKYSIATRNHYHQLSNAGGFFDYCENTKNFISEFKNKGKNKDLFNDKSGHFSTLEKLFTPKMPLTKESRLDKMLDSIGKAGYKDLEKSIENSKLYKKIDKLNNKTLRIQQLEINDLYKKLYQYQNELQNLKLTSIERNKKQFKYEKCLLTIQAKEKRYTSICKKTTNLYRKNFLENQTKAQTALAILESDKTTYPEGSPEREFIDTCRLNFNAQKIYHEKKYRTPETAYDFQPLYLLANARMGRKVEWFCKSAEDRSGVTGDRIEEQLAFRDRMGRFASTPRDRAMIEKNLSHPIHNGSINRQVNDHNDPGSRGMQVKSQFGGEHLHFSEIDNKMAKLPKKIAKLKKTFPQRLQKWKTKWDNSDNISTFLTRATKTLNESKTRLGEITSLGKKAAGAKEELNAFATQLKQYENYQPLTKVKRNFGKAQDLLQTPTFSPSLKDYYQAGKKRSRGFLKAASNATVPINTLNDYKKRAEQAKNALKKISPDLLKDVLYKEDEKTGQLDIIAPPHDSINRTFSETTKAIKVGLLASTDRTIFLALEANKSFEPLIIEFPHGKSIDQINNADIALVLKTVMAAKLMGIDVSVDPKFKEFIQEKYPNEFEKLEKLQRLGSLSEKELKNIYGVDKTSNLSLEDLVDRISQKPPPKP